MSTPFAEASLSGTTPASLKKKRVLLLDSSATTRDLRAETMRKLGMDVDLAADISEARSWWRADLYNLVLVNVESELGNWDKFCEDVRSATPPQQLAFLVGKPAYLADSPNIDNVLPVSKDDHQASWNDVKAALSADVSKGLNQRWGILEASRRISAVRSLSLARSKAVRERPIPPRDSEIRMSKRTTQSRTLDDLFREEIQ